MSEDSGLLCKLYVLQFVSPAKKLNFETSYIFSRHLACISVSKSNWLLYDMFLCNTKQQHGSTGNTFIFGVRFKATASERIKNELAWGIWTKRNMQRKRKYLENTRPSTTSSMMNVKWLDMYRILNSGVRGRPLSELWYGQSLQTWPQCKCLRLWYMDLKYAESVVAGIMDRNGTLYCVTILANFTMSIQNSQVLEVKGER
jgi:hypothetical protein